MRYLRLTNGQIKALEEFTLYDGRVIAAGTLGGTVASPKNLAQSGTCWVFPGVAVTGDAYISGNAVVENKKYIESLEPDSEDNPEAYEELISGNAKIYGNAYIDGGQVSGNARVLGNASVLNNAIVEDDACVSGDCTITSIEATDTWLSELREKLPEARRDALISTLREDLEYVPKPGFADRPIETLSPAQKDRMKIGRVSGKARVQGEALISGGIISDEARVMGKPLIEGRVKNKGYISGCSYIDPTSRVECDGRLSGCARLINGAVLSCKAIVYGDNEVDGETITDASRVTNCPDKNGGNCQCEEESTSP